MKIPKIDTFLSFLLAHNWTMPKVSDKYYFLAPPAQFEFKKPFFLKIPRYQGGEDFPAYMLRLSQSAADLHQWDVHELRELLSIELTDIQKEVNQTPKVRKAKKQITKSMPQFHHILQNDFKTTTTATT